MISFLKSLLRAFTTRSDCFCVALHISSRRVHVIELRSLVIYSGKENRNTERAAHGLSIAVTISELNCQIGNGLGDALDSHLFVVHKPVVLNIKDQNSLILIVVLNLTCASTRALSTMVRESAIKPLQAQPMCLSISTIFSVVVGSMSVDEIRFSTASTTPSPVWIPMAVDPS